MATSIGAATHADVNHSYVDGYGGKGAVCLELCFYPAPRDHAAPCRARPSKSRSHPGWSEIQAKKKNGQKDQDTMQIVLRSASDGSTEIDGDSIPMVGLAVTGPSLAFSIKNNTCTASLSADQRIIQGACDGRTHHYEFSLTRQ